MSENKINVILFKMTTFNFTTLIVKLSNKPKTTEHHN